MCPRSSITMPSLVGLRFHARPGRPKTLSFFCLSVRHAGDDVTLVEDALLNDRHSAHDFAMKTLDY